MKIGEGVLNGSGIAGRPEDFDLGLLPKDLTAQCRSLIEGRHKVHGYASLPDILWKSCYGSFIETHRELRPLLRQASMTRSTKKSNAGFVRIAATILALEVLASGLADWGAFHPQAARLARAILKKNATDRHMPLMEIYLRPPKYPGSAALATLAPPTRRPALGADLYLQQGRELLGERQALDNVGSNDRTSDNKLPDFIVEPLV